MVKSKKKPFRYQKRSAEVTKKRSVSGDSKYDTIYRRDLTKFTLPEGRNKVRPLPPTWDDADHYGYTTYVHYGVGPDKQTYLCKSKMKREACPVCDEINDMKRKGQGDDPAVKQLSPRTSILMWVIAKGQEEKGPMLFPCSYTNDNAWLLQSIDDDSGEVLSPDDPEAGYDLIVSRAGTGLTTKYTGHQLSRKASPLSRDADEMNEWLEFVQENPLPEILEFHDYEYIRAQLAGGVEMSDEDGEDADDDDEDEEESTSPRSKYEDEDEDDDDLEDDDEDDDDDDDDDDDEDDDDEEDEPEPEPVKVRKRKKSK